MNYIGDYDASTVIYGKFTTYQPSTGTPFLLGGTPALSVYKDNSTTQSTTGITLTASFDSVTGMNHFAIDTSADGTFYSAGSNFDVVITTGTVDGVSVVGACVASFTIRKNSSLKPTVAGRTADVTTGGAVGLDWGNVEGQSTTVNLSATTTNLVNTATTLTNLPSAPTDWLTGTAVDASAVTKIQSGLATPTNITAGTITTVNNLTNLPTIPNNWLTAAGINTGAITAAKFAANAITAAAIATDAVAEIADGVWDEALSGHTTPGTTGAALSAAGAAGDPWSIPLPGAYAVGTAGKILGDYTAPDNAGITAIKAKTDSLTFTVANNVDVNIQYVNDVQVIGNGEPGNTWGPV